MALTDFLLSDGELNRLLAKFPELRASSDEYCPTCEKTGHYRWRDVDNNCDCAGQLRLYKKYLSSGIGKPYQRLSWDDMVADVHPELEPIRKYVANPEPYIKRGLGVLLWGPPGTGKTMVSTLILKDLIRSGYTGFSATMAAMVEYFTAGWGGKTEEKDWFTDKFLNSQILLLDEVRRENRLAESTFDHILRTRVHEGRPTILTTNLTPAELENGYGSSILSLLVEQSIAVNLTIQNYRGKAHDRVMREIALGETRPIQ
jgi:DNA replication protein DnaC